MMFFSAYAKDKIGILIGIAFNLEAAFGTKVTSHNVNSMNPCTWDAFLFPRVFL